MPAILSKIDPYFEEHLQTALFELLTIFVHSRIIESIQLGNFLSCLNELI